jgi:thiol peroxidase
MPQERTGVVTFKGNPMTLIGPAIKAGDRAPDFRAINSKLEQVTLASSKGKVRLFSVVPSLDTPVCSEQTKKFGAALNQLPSSVQVYTVSADLPFAQSRWCGAEHVEMTTLSDHRELSFATSYGVLIKELKLLTRSIFVVDAADKVTYVEIVPEITSHPSYDKAIAAVKAAAR